MRRALEYARAFDMPVIQHCEDHSLTAHADMNEGVTATRLGLRGWPRVAEDIIVARDVLLAEYARAKYHAAHLSTFGAVRIIREAKSRGLSVTCEVTPHHLLLTDAAVIGYDTACKVNPPLREAEDIEALQEALADGTIDAIATDHAPHSALEKDCEFSEASPGIIGLELCFGLLAGLVRNPDRVALAAHRRAIDPSRAHRGARRTRHSPRSGREPRARRSGDALGAVARRAPGARAGTRRSFLEREIQGARAPLRSPRVRSFSTSRPALTGEAPHTKDSR